MVVCSLESLVRLDFMRSANEVLTGKKSLDPLVVNRREEEKLM